MDTQNKILNLEDTRLTDEQSQDIKETRLTNERNRKRRKLALETNEEREARLARKRELYRQKTDNQRDERNYRNMLNMRKRRTSNIPKNPGNLSTSDRRLLCNFRDAINKLRNKLCTTCNERFPSITLFKGECRRCYHEKGNPKKFSAGNNMDPGMSL
jgi:hypothetical protein